MGLLSSRIQVDFQLFSSVLKKSGGLFIQSASQVVAEEVSPIPCPQSHPILCHKQITPGVSVTFLFPCQPLIILAMSC